MLFGAIMYINQDRDHHLQRKEPIVTPSRASSVKDVTSVADPLLESAFAIGDKVVSAVQEFL